MLRSFRLENHKSFADEQELLLIPAAGTSSLATVPVVAIYGANASGKSNLLDGLAFMQSAVLDSFSGWRRERGIPRTSFRLIPDKSAHPSVYVIEFIADEVRYTYGFSINDNHVLEEWLYSYPEKRKRIIFERSADNISIGSTLADFKARIKLVEELTRPNVLFLSSILETNLTGRMAEVFLPIYWWFQELLKTPDFKEIRYQESSGVRPLGNGSKYGDGRYSIERLVAPDSPVRARVLDLIRAADIGISDIRIDEDAGELDGISGLVFTHGSSRIEFRALDESSGTLSWLHILPGALRALDDGHILIIDEIDTSLHPLLTAQLIALFQDRETNRKGGQLIFTSHDPSLLGSVVRPGGLLQRDQIWFVQKDPDGASSLYPLTDFKPRREHSIERRYLSGAYGAVPEVDAPLLSEAVRRG